MSAIDFANSYMTWFGKPNDVIARIQLEAACTVIDEGWDTEETYYLIAPCRAEHTHSDGQLSVMPGYDFRGIFGKDEHLLVRKHYVSEPDYLEDSGLDGTRGRILAESGPNRELWMTSGWTSAGFQTTSG